MIRRRTLLAGGSALAVLVLLCAPIDTRFDDRLPDALWNFGHVPGFALLTFFALTALRRRSKLSRSGTVLAGSAVLTLLAVATELVQSQVGRSFSATDIGGDAAGILAGAAAWLIRDRAARPAILATALPALAAVAVYAAHPAAVATDTLAAWRAFPVLADFCQPRQLLRFQNPVNLRIERGGGHCMASVRLGGSHYTGFNLSQFPRDWSGYDSVSIGFFNPSAEPLTLTCRIHDRQHDNRYEDRFNQAYVLPPGNSTVNISLAAAERAPDGRAMNMSTIAGLLCFTTEPEDRLIWLRGIRLG